MDPCGPRAAPLTGERFRSFAGIQNCKYAPIMSSLGRVAVLLSALGAIPFASLAQETGSISGVVRSSLDQPLSGVLVFVEGGFRSTTTDGSGAFRLDGVPAGDHVLGYRRMGHAPRAFNLAIVAGEVLDVGRVVLQSGPAPSATVRGVVTEQVGGQPLSGAVVRMNGQVLAQSDQVGGFDAAGVAVQWGPNEVTIMHDAFAQAVAVDTIWVTNHNETLQLLVALDVEPIALPALAVDAAVTARSPRLEERGFYARRAQSSNGVFWTAPEIEARDADDWDDLLRGVRFPRTRAGQTFGVAQTGPCGSAMRNDLGDPTVMAAEPIAFLNGNHVGNLPQLTESVKPEMIDGLEIYRGVAGLPPEFNILGAECGVVAVWTR